MNVDSKNHFPEYEFEKIAIYSKHFLEFIKSITIYYCLFKFIFIVKIAFVFGVVVVGYLSIIIGSAVSAFTRRFVRPEIASKSTKVTWSTEDSTVGTEMVLIVKVNVNFFSLQTL